MILQPLRGLIRPTLLLAPLLLTGCAAMETARLKMLDDAVSISHGAQLGNYRRVAIERVECTGDTCTPQIEGDLTRAVSKTITDACYAAVDTEEYSRYASYFARRLSRATGADVEIKGPGGGMIRFVQFNPDLRDALVEELQIDAVVSTTVQVGTPDSVTKFRPVIYDVTMADAKGRQTVWHARISQDMMDDKAAAEELRRGMDFIGEAIRRKASLCSLPPPSAAQFEGIEVVDSSIKLQQKIYFEIDSDQLTTRSTAVLDRLAAFLQAHPEILKIRIEGHTDDVGDDAYNLELSARRAKTVEKYLVNKGIKPQAVDSAGMGETVPLSPNTTEAARTRNRRVEFKVTQLGR